MLFKLIICDYKLKQTSNAEFLLFCAWDAFSFAVIYFGVKN